MENVQQDQPVYIHSKLNASTFKPHLSSGLCFSSSFRQISDESFPYMSGIFDDTMNPLISKGPKIVLSEQEKHSLKNDLAVTSSEIKLDNKLSVPEDSRDGIDFSTCVTSTQDSNEDFSDVTRTNSRTDGSCESSSGTDSSEVRGPLKNGTFNLPEEHKEKSSVLNCTTSVITETPAANMTFENKPEKPLCSAFDAPVNVTTELPAGKLNCTFDHIQSNMQKQEWNSGTFHSDKDSEKCCTFTKDPTEPSSSANSNKSLNITEDLSKRRNGVSDGENCINLDVSHCSLFSLDDVLDLKPCPIVASTPIVLDSRFAGFGLERPTEMQQHLSVINSMDSELNEDLGGMSKQAQKDASKSNQSTTRSERPSKIQKVPTQNFPTSLHSASGSATVNKPLSKLPFRGKIPQPSTKVNIPKTQIPLRPPSAQVTCQTVKSRITASSQTVNQPGTSSSGLTGIRRMVLDSKGKSLSSAKNMSSTVKTTSLAPSTVGCNVTADSKASKTYASQSKLSGLQPPGRGRFGFKSSGSGGFSDAVHSQFSNKPSALSGFPKKHGSAESLPLAKRKKDLQNQPVYANLRPGGAAPKQVTAPIGIRPKISTGHQ